MFRARFQVFKTTKFSSGGTEITMYPIFDESIPQEQSLGKATPIGNVIMFLDNAQAQQFFELDKHYYLDFTKAES